jgi:hypothetical protein
MSCELEIHIFQGIPPEKYGSPIHMTFDKLRGLSLEKRISNSHDI